MAYMCDACRAPTVASDDDPRHDQSCPLPEAEGMVWSDDFEGWLSPTDAEALEVEEHLHDQAIMRLNDLAGERGLPEPVEEYIHKVHPSGGIELSMQPDDFEPIELTHFDCWPRKEHDTSRPGEWPEDTDAASRAFMAHLCDYWRECWGVFVDPAFIAQGECAFMAEATRVWASLGAVVYDGEQFWEVYDLGPIKERESHRQEREAKEKQRRLDWVNEQAMAPQYWVGVDDFHRLAPTAKIEKSEEHHVQWSLTLTKDGLSVWVLGDLEHRAQGTYYITSEENDALWDLMRVRRKQERE